MTDTYNAFWINDDTGATDCTACGMAFRVGPYQPEQWSTELIAAPVLGSEDPDNDRECFRCWDSDAAIAAAESGEEAAEEYIEGGNWGDEFVIRCHHISTWRRGWHVDEDEIIEGCYKEDEHRVVRAPEEPACLHGHEHDWRAPHWLVGGIAENPGVTGKGGGVVAVDYCAHCWTKRTVDTWATDHTGQTYERLSYEVAGDLVDAARDDMEFALDVRALYYEDTAVDGDAYRIDVAEIPGLGGAWWCVARVRQSDDEVIEYQLCHGETERDEAVADVFGGAGLDVEAA